MNRLLLALGLLFGLTASAFAQTPCVGVGGVNNINVPGVVCKQEPAVNSYVANGIAMAPASSATDLACITGAANIVVRVQSIRIDGTAGTLINVPTTITKHASANTGGTANTGTALPVPYKLDSTNAAPLATTTSYSANPTIADASPGLVDTGILVLTATGTLAGSTGLYFDWDQRGFVEAPTLRGVAQQACVNLNGTSPSSGVVNVSFRWTESAQ